MGSMSHGIASLVQVSKSILQQSLAKSERLIRKRGVADPFKVIKTGEGYEIQGDPMKPLEAELARYRYHPIPQVPTFTGEPA